MKNLLPCMLIALCIAACSKPADPIKIKASEAWNDIYRGQRVQFEGTLIVPDRIISFGKMEMAMLDDAGTTLPTLRFQSGGCRNCMEVLPAEYQTSDVRIHDKDNQIIGHRGRARITGEMLAATELNCKLNVEVIEKLED